jgi:gliding motility-associated-like protein
VTDTVRLTVIPVLAIISSQRNPSCGQNNGNIIGAASGASLIYTWLRNGVFYSDGASQILNAPAGTYAFAVYDKITGCSDTVKNIVLTTNGTFPSFDTITTRGVNCFGEKNGQITVSAKGGSGTYSYSWSHDPLLTATTANGLTSGTPYKVTLSDGVCPPIDSTIILDGPADSVRVSIVVSPDNCKQSKGEARAISTGGSGGYQYVWNTGSTIDSISGILGSTRVFVTITDQNGCGAVASDSILNTGSPSVQLESVDSACTGGTEGKIVVLATSNDGPFSYSWSHDNLLNSPTANGLAPGSYTVSVTNSLNCAEVISATVIAYGSGGGGTLDLGADQTILLGQTASITILSSVVLKSKIWTPNFVATDDNGVSFVAPTKTTTYTLEATYGNGCKLQDAITIVVDSAVQKLVVPTIFTPNGDGLNDLFYVNEVGIEQLDIKIFDRWGNLVYQSNNPSFKWDGKASLLGGELMNGNYPFVILYKTFDSKSKKKEAGFITMIK